MSYSIQIIVNAYKESIVVFSNVDAKNSVLLVIDLQELLAPVIKDFPNILKSTLQLAQAGIIHGVPCLVTEQYVKGLGETNQQIKNTLPNAAYFHKTYFSVRVQSLVLLIR